MCVCVEVIIITTITIMVVAFCLLFRRIRQVKLDRERISTKRDEEREIYDDYDQERISILYLYNIIFCHYHYSYVCIYCTLKYCVKKLHY